MPSILENESDHIENGSTNPWLSLQPTLCHEKGTRSSIVTSCFPTGGVSLQPQAANGFK